MKKTNTVRVNGNMIFKGHKLTIGLDLGDRWSYYCVLDEAGEILLEQKLATTPEAMKQTFERIPRSLIAMETGTHSPWVSRLRSAGFEVENCINYLPYDKLCRHAGQPDASSPGNPSP